jgi:hypothetical protein
MCCFLNFASHPLRIVEIPLVTKTAIVVIGVLPSEVLSGLGRTSGHEKKKKHFTRSLGYGIFVLMVAFYCFCFELATCHDCRGAQNHTNNRA